MSSREECDQFREFEYENGGQYRTVITREKKVKKRKKEKGGGTESGLGTVNTSTFIGAVQLP